MTDLEMLELAAKAAGYSPLKEIQRFCTAAGGSYVELVTSDGFEWNPLTDDGDALRLAVKLGLWVHIGKYDVAIEGTPIEESCVKCPYAATRRAIVRAAAKMASISR